MLHELSLDVPSGSKTSKVGSLERKHTNYDLWYLGEDTNDAVGGEEVKNLSVLVPRAKKGGKLFTGKSFSAFCTLVYSSSRVQRPNFLLDISFSRQDPHFRRQTLPLKALKAHRIPNTRTRHAPRIPKRSSSIGLCPTDQQRAQQKNKWT